ncbi:MAG TPA: Na+/H+ antiporter NhaC family protein [Woeseiaceae bacterium]|nr:Na+/H+ antiporter NhaC family protein [Woeseiaceae bacterium]
MPVTGAASLLPVAATLVISLAARNVLVGLFSGVIVGAWMIGDEGALMFLPRLVRDHLVPEVADSYNASVLVLLAFIGGFVRLIETSGGGAAFARSAARWVAGRRRAVLAAWTGGVAIFFSDLGTPLIVGPVFQPLMDRLRLSRQKLAFVLDSTSSPVAILIPFIGWGVFIMSVIGDAYAANGLVVDEWHAFVSAIGFQIYAWLAIAMVPLLTWLDFDYGPMRQAQAAARDATGRAAPLDAGGDPRARPVLVWLPLLVLGAVLFATLGRLGFPFAQVAGADFRAALSAAYFFAALTLLILLVAGRLQSPIDALARYIEGMSGMMSIAATLVLAWALGDVSSTLGTGAYVAELARQGVGAASLPAVIFVLASIISFATGSSWGTIVIMMPLAVPAAIATGAAMPVVIGAVLSGGLFGDHSSPVSETTLLSSTGAGTTPLEHFRTQLPYALTNGAIAAAMFMVAGLTSFAWSAPLAVALQCVVLLAIRRRQRRRRAN